MPSAKSMSSLDITEGVTPQWCEIGGTVAFIWSASLQRNRWEVQIVLYMLDILLYLHPTR